MTDKKTTIHRGRKFEQVRDGASRIFLRDGFAAASVDDIARAARVSKATLYSYFPDKKLMFQEVVECALDDAFSALPAELGAAPASWPEPGAGLERYLTAFGTWLAQPDISDLHRLVDAEARRFPALRDSFRRRQHDALLKPLVGLLDRWSGNGLFTVGDSTLLARQIVYLATAEFQQAAEAGNRAPIPAETVARIVGEIACLTLRASHGCKDTHQVA